jgi:PKD repeat protein
MGLNLDDAAPIIHVSANKSAVAAGPGGTAVVYDAATADDDDSAFTPTILCTHASGSVFPVGVTTVTCTATDSAGNQDSDTFTVTVAQNSPPELTVHTPVFGQLFAAPATVMLDSSVTDAGPTGDTLTCTIDWGDGSPAETGPATGGCDGTHAYATAGVYTITVTVTDSFGASATVSVMIVVYSGNGFVTGGGWINSPAGAYSAQPTLAGRASFGFVSKYHNGKTVPEGQTEFQFRLGNLNFHSETYEWLLVSGHKARYKGTGTINGSGSYSFTITIQDGQRPGGTVDKFRIRIVDGSGVVYDNGLGAADTIDADPQAIASGSIVIHKG